MPRRPITRSWLLLAGQVPRVRWDDPSLEEYLQRGEPVVITGGCPLTKALVGKWSFSHLSKLYGDEELPNTHFAPRHCNRFARFYGRGLGEGGVLRQPFAKFVEQARANEALPSPSWRFYMQASVLWAIGDKADAETVEKVGGEMEVPAQVHASRKIAHAKVRSELVSELNQMGMDWLASAMHTAGCEGFHSCTLWAGNGGGCTPMHFDNLSNFFTQLVGRKRLLLFPPEQWPHVYPYPCTHPMDSYAMVDVEAPDLERFPSLARAKGLECTLNAGDVLWLPSFWFHHVRQLDPGRENLSLNCWIGSVPQVVNMNGSVIKGTFLGGRAKLMDRVHRRLAPPRVDD